VGSNENSKDQTLVKSIISVAHDMNYRVVATGVETAEIYSFLADAGCDEVQGYFLSHPLCPADFQEWIRNSRDKKTVGMLSLLGGTGRRSRSVLGY
jgi:EAL domain-containing protein (putative c-di-GMP-specific phosphodiesterase class I)